jgi:hypothetical protein
LSFYKKATCEPLGVHTNKGWSKSASKVVSNYMNRSDLVDFEGILDEVADFYKISRDPSDYLLIPARAVSSDRPNENLDGWDYEELVRFDPKIGMRVYRTFEAKPHYVNHKSDNPLISRGVLIDASLNEDNPADDNVRETVFNATGKEVDQDVFVECLIAMDTTKDPELARAYKNGSVDKFSMGCDVEYTSCSACGNVARSVGQFCSHIRNKMSRKAIRMPNGSLHTPYEKCGQTIFQELSAVDLPADRSAVIQDGILEVSPKLPSYLANRNFSNLSREELTEISKFVARNASIIPDSLARVINNVLNNSQ